MELTVGSAGDTLPATLDEPARAARGGLVVLHAEQAGHRSHPLYEHLSRTLTSHGVSVLRFDRRSLRTMQQADDAVAAIRLLRDRTGDVPMGLWGMGAGAEAAAAATVIYPAEIDFLIAISARGAFASLTLPVLEFYGDNVARPLLMSPRCACSAAVALPDVQAVPTEQYTNALVSWLDRLLGAR